MEKDSARKYVELLVREIAKGAGIDITPYDMDQIVLGMYVELEHGSKFGQDTNLTNNDPLKTLQVVLVHLKEKPKYYTDSMPQDWGKLEEHLKNYKIQENKNMKKLPRRLPVFEEANTYEEAMENIKNGIYGGTKIGMAWTWALSGCADPDTNKYLGTMDNDDAKIEYFLDVYSKLRGLSKFQSVAELKLKRYGTPLMHGGWTKKHLEKYKDQ